MTLKQAYIFLLAPFIYMIVVAELWFYTQNIVFVGMYGVGYILYLISLLCIISNYADGKIPHDYMFGQTVIHTIYQFLFNNLPDELGRLIWHDIMGKNIWLNPETRNAWKLIAFACIMFSWYKKYKEHKRIIQQK